MSALLESILNGDYVSANEIFEQKMVELQEQKLVEIKKQIQAEMFGMSRAEIEAKKKAGYRKAADVLGDPRDIKIKPLVKTKKIKKKKVTEAVEVQPDPEGRVRGGSAKKGTFRRNIRAARIKGARKIIQKGGELGGSIAAGAVGAGQEIKSRVSAAKQAYQAHKASQQKASQSPFPSNMHRTQSQDQSREMPSFVKRNVNTLLGREPDYDKSKLTQDDKIRQSGKLGKYVRSAVGRLASDASQTW